MSPSVAELFPSGSQARHIRAAVKVRHGLVITGLLALGHLSTLQAAAPAPYWSYSYQGVDVMAPGDSEYSRTLAHNVHRLEVTLTRLLQLDSHGPPRPAHIYSLHHADFAPLVSSDVEAQSFFSNEESYEVIDASSAEWHYKGAYLGMSGNVLWKGKRAYPQWVHTGFARMAGTAQIRGTRVTVGAVDKWLGRVISASRLKSIPARELLTMSLNDPLLNDPIMREKYDAECWVLVHLITIEGMYKSEFSRYLALLDTGATPSDAFASGFQVPYEDLDKLMRDTVSKGTLKRLSYDVPDEPDTNQPQLLSSAEAKQRIAALSEVVRTQRR